MSCINDNDVKSVIVTMFSFRELVISLFSFFLSIKNRTIFINDLLNLIHFFLNISSRYILMISCSLSQVDINKDEEIISYVSSIT